MTFDVDVDLLNPSLHASGEVMDIFRRVRAVSPIAWTRGRRGHGYWSIVGYRELVAIARDPSTFSSYWGTRPEALRPAAAPRPLHNLDPPAHGQLRSIAGLATTRAQLDALAPALLSTVEQAIGAFVHHGGGDGVQLAEHIPPRVFAAWLGIDPTLAGELLARVVEVHTAGAALIDATVDDPSRPVIAARARAASERMAEFMREAIARAPDGSVLEQLDAQAGDAALGLAMLFVEAGLPTTIDALASSIATLVTVPPFTVDALAVEELLRRASPIAQFARRATRDVSLGDRTIREGDQVVLWFVAANHDERAFVDPDRFVPSRTPNAHVAFGVGPHHCVGAALGRRIVRAVLPALARHRLEPDGPFPRRASSYLRGYSQLPLRVA